MPFIRAKKVKGKIYYYRVESVREGTKVRQRILHYFGTTPPEGYVVPTPAASNEESKKALRGLRYAYWLLPRGERPS